MAEKIVSPGVFTRENDLSFLAQGIGEIGAAVIGPFQKGPAFVPTVVSTQSEFEEIFGTPNGEYYTGYTVQNYIREAGTVTIVRVGHIGGYSQVKPLGIAVQASGSGASKLIGVLHNTHQTVGGEGVGFDIATNNISAPFSSSAFLISGSQLGTSVSASVLPSAGNDISDVFGDAARGPKKAYAYKYFEKAGTDIQSVLTAGGKVVHRQLATQDFSQDIQHASTPYIQSQLISGERHNLFRLHTLGDGSNYNKEYKVSIFNVRAAGSVNSTDYALFSIAIRGYSDTDKRKVVLETYNNINLDPASPNYIKKVIGDRNVTIDANGKQTENGDYVNRSKFVRVECVEEGSFPITAGPFAHAEYINPIYDGTDETVIPAVIFSTGSGDNNSSNSINFSGIDLESATVKIDNNNYLAPIPASATKGANTVFAFDAAFTAIVGGSVSTKNFGYELTGSAAVDKNKRQFTVGFQGGFDGISPTIKAAKADDAQWGAGNAQGFNLSTSTSSG